MPSEYLSYYPQPPQIGTDEIESQEISCNKKNDRLFNVTGTKNTDQKNVVKLNTNSILKYFGTNVEKAIALPSKSINKIIDIFVPPVNITDVHVVSTSTAEDSEVSDIRTSIATVIKEDDVVINKVSVQPSDKYGLDWAKQSYSFDTILTILLYFFPNLSVDHRKELTNSSPRPG